MRGITFALLITFVGCQKNDLEPVFSDVKTYLYNYEGLILNGLEKDNSAKSGIKLTCKVKISKVSEENHLLKLLSPQLEEYNGIWPRDSFTKASKTTEILQQCFAQVFKFEYRRGHVGNIYAPKDVGTICVNIIKGILNLMQITIKESLDMYELQEPGVGGTCFTTYLIQEKRKDSRVSILRSKDLNNCTDKVVKDVGMTYVRPCPTCPVNITNTRGTVAFNYNLKRTDTGSLIIQAESQQIYEISPFNEFHGTAVMVARQNMTLIETITNQERMSETPMQNHGTLYYQFEEDLSQMALHLIRTNNPELAITERLEQLVQQNQIQIHEETPAKFLELIELSRAATHENLESVWKQCAKRQQYRYWLLSAVAVAGTSDTLAFLKQRILSEDLNVLESAITLTLAFHLTKTDKLTFKVAAELLTSQAVRKSLILHNLAYLAYGSMINRHCCASPHCPTEILQPLHDLAMGAYKSHEENAALALKAMGNAGEPASINYIKKFLPGFSTNANDLPARLQRIAIQSLRKISRKKAATIREITFEIFRNRTVDAQARMVACIAFFETKPTLPLVTAMASFVEKENNLQVASFAYSHMKALAMGRIPQLNNLSAACKIAIKLISRRLEWLSIRYSRVLHIDGYMSNYVAGALGRVYLLNKPNTLFPIIFAKIRGFYGAAAMDIVEVGIRLENLFDVVKRQNIPFEQYSTYKKIKELGKLLQGLKEIPLENPEVAAYLKIFSHEIAYGLADKEFFQKAEKLVTRLGELLTTLFQKGLAGRWTQPILAGEFRLIVPTCVGLPLEFGLYTTGVVHAAAKVNGQLSPALTSDFRSKQLLETNIDLRAEINSSVYTHLVAVMGINTPHFQTGLEVHAKFHADVPVNFNANIDLKEERFKFESTPVQQETELLSIRTKLYRVSRFADEPKLAKMLPLLPEVPGFDVLDKCFKSSKLYDVLQQKPKFDITSRKFTYNLEDNFHHSKTAISYPTASYVKLPALGFQTCFTMKRCNTGFPEGTYLHKILEKCEIKLAMKPVVAKTKIQLDIKLGSETDSEINHEEYNESSSEENQRRKGKKGKTKVKKTRENEQFNISRTNKPSGLVATLNTIQNNKKLKICQVVLESDLHSSRPTVHIFVSDLQGYKRMKFCGDVSILSSQNAEGYLKWGKDCRDYKISTKIAYGQLAGHPAMQIKLEWPQIPSRIEEVGRELSMLIPGTAYMLGFPEVEQKNPSQQASVILALTSSRTCSLVAKLPHVMIYGTNIKIPFALPVDQDLGPLAKQSHVWSFISDVPPSVLENLKGVCSISQDSVTTFNGITFNYSMSPSCNHILAQDCSSQLKFLVMRKKAEDPNDLNTIHINLANLEIVMVLSNGIVKLWVDGAEILAENLPYVSSSAGYIFITNEENGLLLKAPEIGIEKMYYDGNMLKIQVPFWMTGKTCGICGRYDAEYEQEYKMPNGYIAENAMSFTQSWTVPDDSCATESAAIPA
ncbi:vitellogenin-2 isoform X1 [Anolis carolinensis]|uniref:vitellogenin-2 isoform X1 n=1 Tax=Anolis carolinensis TaxID=28377 RepID=UPI002F2B368E